MGRTTIAAGVFAVALALPGAMGTAAGAEREPFLAAPGLVLPASLAGDLPCADCPGIRHHLDLMADGTFQLRRVWLDRDLTVDAIGRWRADPLRGAVILESGLAEPLAFAVEDTDRVRLLDRAGAPIASDLPYDLVGLDAPAPIEPALRLEGEMRYLADAASFEECLTGKRYPMAMEADFAAAERAYLAAAARPPEPVHVAFEGAIVERPAMDGPGSERQVVVTAFEEADATTGCARPAGPPALENAYWRPIRVGGRAIDPLAGRIEAHLVLLTGEEARYAATMGCNRMAGGYVVDGAGLRFTRGLATRMACPAPLEGYERALGAALTATRGWRIDGDTLELVDDGGAPLARFEAAYRRSGF